jgi:hypothetical protein
VLAHLRLLDQARVDAGLLELLQVQRAVEVLLKLGDVRVRPLGLPLSPGFQGLRFFFELGCSPLGTLTDPH